MLQHHLESPAPGRRVSGPSLAVSRPPCNWDPAQCTLGTLSPIPGPSFPPLLTWSSTAGRMVRLLTEDKSGGSEVRGVTEPRPSSPTPPLGPATHLSSRASWTDCSRLLGREGLGSEVSLSGGPTPSPTASLSFTHPLSSSFPSSVHSSSHCGETESERWGEKQRDRKAV